MEGGVRVTKEEKKLCHRRLSFLKVIQELILKRLILLNKMVVLDDDGVRKLHDEPGPSSS